MPEVSHAQQRTCPKCNTLKSHTAFWKTNRTRDGLQSYCINCIYAMRRSSAKYNAAARRYYHRRGHVLKRAALYGLTAEQLDQLYDAADQRCQICGEPETPNRRLAVDHDHDTGVVRGVLCTKCNSAIGLLNDDASLLQKAMAYLGER